VRFYAENGRFGTTYDDDLRLTGKRVVDFLLVLIELFSLGITAETLRANIGSKSAISLQWGPDDPKFQVEGVAPHQPFFSENYRLNDLSYCIKNLDRSFFRFVTMHAFDRRTDGQRDGQTEFSSLDRVCIPCSAVKSRAITASHNSIIAMSSSNVQL